jgi:hypothetical protein
MLASGGETSRAICVVPVGRPVRSDARSTSSWFANMRRGDAAVRRPDAQTWRSRWHSTGIWPRSLAQCQQWLSRHLPGAERISVVSNSEGARRAAAEADAATLGSETAAALYGLAVVEARVEDESSNTTRFLVLGQIDAAPSGRDKTSLVMGRTTSLAQWSICCNRLPIPGFP